MKFGKCHRFYVKQGNGDAMNMDFLILNVEYPLLLNNGEIIELTTRYHYNPL